MHAQADSADLSSQNISRTNPGDGSAATDEPVGADAPIAEAATASHGPAAAMGAAASAPSDDGSQPAAVGGDCRDAEVASGEEPPPRRRGLLEKIEAFVARLSTRNNFWHRICSWIWLPFAFRSGIRMRRDGHTYSAVLPFRRFNRNWYEAMAGAALLGNSEIAGGMHVFKACKGHYRVVCKHLEYRFLRPCVGPAVYRVTPRQDIAELAAAGREFNITVDMEIVQVMRTPKERERRVGRCVATFHATPIAQHKQKRQERQQRRRRAARAQG